MPRQILKCPECGHPMLSDEAVCWECWLAHGREHRPVPDSLFRERDARVADTGHLPDPLIARYAKDGRGFWRLLPHIHKKYS